MPKFVIEINDFTNEAMQEYPFQACLDIIQKAVDRVRSDELMFETFYVNLIDSNGNIVGYFEWETPDQSETE